MELSPEGSRRVTHVNTVPDVYSVYTWENVAFMFWFGPPTLESCAVLERGSQKQHAEHPEGLSLVNVMVPGGRSMPSAEVRTEITRIMRESTKNAAAIGVIIPGTGFWASALRGMVLALSMMRSRQLPLQIFADATELAEWLVPIHGERTGVRFQAAELVRALKEAEDCAHGRSSAA